MSQEDLNKINADYMDKHFKSIYGIYVDLTLIKDTRMGLLISKCNPEQISHMSECLHLYKHQHNKSFLDSFPKLPFSEKELQETYYSGEESLACFLYAPDTDLYPLLYSSLISVREQNIRAEENVRCTLSINTWPLKVEPIMEHYLSLLKEHFSSCNCDVKFITIDPKTLSSKFWKRNRYIFLDDFSFADDENTGLYKALITDKAMYAHKLYTPKQASEETWEIWLSQGLRPEDTESLALFYSPSSAVMQMCCEFSYLNLSFEKKVPKE